MEKVYMNNQLTIALFSFPMASKEAVNVLLYDLLRIIGPISKNIYLLTSNIPKNKNFGDNIVINDLGISLHHRDKFRYQWISNIFQVIKIYYIQLKMCWIFLKTFRKFEIAVFYVGGANLFLPLLLAYLFRKKIIFYAIGSASKGYKKAYNNGFFSLGGFIADLLNLTETIIFNLSDIIMVESESVVNFLELEKYGSKVSTLGARYIKINEFKIKKSYNERNNLIGYIGRLENAKGIINILEGFKIILERYHNIQLFLGGDGPLFDKIQAIVEENDLTEKVILGGWIPHDEVTHYLNEMKIFIFPSSSEGLPTAVLEAMACGTIVISTPVGGIPDLIKDSETGFILKNNSPDSIAKTVFNALNYTDVDIIIDNARKLIENNYSYESATKRYKKIFSEILTD